MTFGRRPPDPRQPLPPPPAIGDRVAIIAGRHAGAIGELVALEAVPTPSGRQVTIALVRRPRAGDTYVFPTDLRRA